MNGQLPLVRGVELDFENLWARGSGFQRIIQRLHELQQALLGSVTSCGLLQDVEVRVVHFRLQVHVRAVVVFSQKLGVVTQRRDLQQSFEARGACVVVRFIRRSLRQNRQIRNVLPGWTQIRFVIDPYVHNSHSVLRQSTSLIRGDDSGRTQSFNRFQVLHQNVLRVHTFRGQRERHGNGRQQTFRHVRNDDTNHKHNILDNVRPVG